MICRFAAIILFSATILVGGQYAQSSRLVSVRGHDLFLDGKPYYFVGTNYWYGGLLGLEKDKRRGIQRLRRELDRLKANGVTNLRLMAGAEGSGSLNGVTRVGPALQPEQGKFDASVLDGLDLVIHEMGRRRMKAVIFFSNNWEWSGGFQQYLIWNGVIDRKWLTTKPSWDELRDITAKFYSCEPCKAAYRNQVEFVLRRTNKYNKRKYIADPTIMAWEIANEPRPMRPAANIAYARFITGMAGFIRSRDTRHLVAIGHEGWIGTEDIALFDQVHADKNIDYLTIHIWPKNWGWLGSDLAKGFPNALAETKKYIRENAAIAAKLNKPMVIEEFGLPRDALSFDAASTTTFRDQYYREVLSFIGNWRGGNKYIAGANFWAFGGTARSIQGQLFWKVGDEYMGDPPMEEQGLNTVFTSDVSTWRIIRAASRR